MAGVALSVKIAGATYATVATVLTNDLRVWSDASDVFIAVPS
jgi:hypothetical protein